MEKDYGRWMVWFLSEMTGGPLPPYLLEIVMRDGRSFYVHSGNGRDEETQSVVVNVWDLRALCLEDEIEIKRKLDHPKIWNESKENPWSLHDKLSLGRLRCRLDDVAYVVEWWTRVWDPSQFFPPEQIRPIGFVPPSTNTQQTK